MKRFLTILFVSCIYSNSYSANTETEQESYKILFIGSSYFNYNDLPGLLNGLTDRSAKEVFIDQFTPSGLYLADHVLNSTTLSKINEKDWDYVILQGVGSLIAYPDYYTHHPVLPALFKMKSLVADNCDSTKMLFCLPWAYEDGMTWLRGWDDTYEDMQLEIIKNTESYAAQVGFIIAPVGNAWYDVLKEKDYPLHYLHLADWNHPSLKGSFLMACVIYSTIFQERTTSISYYGGLPHQEARYFQEVASDIVLGNDDDFGPNDSIPDNDTNDFWHRPNPVIDLEESTELTALHLYQNSPNPFNSSTSVNYKVINAAHVEITLYDMFGKLYSTLVNEYSAPGKYSFTFDANHLPPGTYYCRLKNGQEYITKKMTVIR